MEHKEQREESIDKMEILKEKGIVYFDVKLTPEERGAINEIKIEKELRQFNYYGPANETLIENLNAYFKQLEGNTEKTINTISKIVSKIAEGMQKDFNKESAWVMVRVSLPNDEFDIPRWHKDSGYFKSKEGNYESTENKLVFTIKGAPTRFAEATDKERYDQLEREDMANSEKNENSEESRKEEMRIRKELMLAVTELKPPKDGQATIYFANSPTTSKIHSEPPIHEPRIFMSVLPGLSEQVDEFKKRYEK